MEKAGRVSAELAHEAKERAAGLKNKLIGGFSSGFSSLLGGKKKQAEQRPSLIAAMQVAKASPKTPISDHDETLVMSSTATTITSTTSTTIIATASVIKPDSINTDKDSDEGWTKVDSTGEHKVGEGLAHAVTHTQKDYMNDGGSKDIDDEAAKAWKEQEAKTLKEEEDKKATAALVWKEKEAKELAEAKSKKEADALAWKEREAKEESIRLEQEANAAKEKALLEKIAKEKADKEAAAEEKIAKEKADKEAAAEEKALLELIAKEKADKEAAAEKLIQEKASKEAAAEKVIKEKKDKNAAAKVKADKEAKEKDIEEKEEREKENVRLRLQEARLLKEKADKLVKEELTDRRDLLAKESRMQAEGEKNRIEEEDLAAQLIREMEVSDEVTIEAEERKASIAKAAKVVIAKPATAQVKSNTDWLDNVSNHVSNATAGLLAAKDKAVPLGLGAVGNVFGAVGGLLSGSEKTDKPTEAKASPKVVVAKKADANALSQSTSSESITPIPVVVKAEPIAIVARASVASQAESENRVLSVQNSAKKKEVVVVAEEQTDLQVAEGSTSGSMRGYLKSTMTSVEGEVTKSLQRLMGPVVVGIPSAGVLSIFELKKELLEKAGGDADKAVEQVIMEETDPQGQMWEGITSMAMSYIPFAGFPAVLGRTFWNQMRNVAVIAALYGHDPSQPDVQCEMLYCLIPEQDVDAAKKDKEGSDDDEDEEEKEPEPVLTGADMQQGMNMVMRAVARQMVKAGVKKATGFQNAQRVYDAVGTVYDIKNKTGARTPSDRAKSRFEQTPEMVEELTQAEMSHLKVLLVAIIIPNAIKTGGAIYNAQTKVNGMLIVAAILTVLAIAYGWWHSKYRPNYTTIIFGTHAFLQVLSALFVGEAVVNVYFDFSLFQVSAAILGSISLLYRHRKSSILQQTMFGTKSLLKLDGTFLKPVESKMLIIACTLGVFEILSEIFYGEGFLSLFKVRTARINLVLTAISSTALNRMVDELARPATVLRILKYQQQDIGSIYMRVLAGAVSVATLAATQKSEVQKWVEKVSPEPFVCCGICMLRDHDVFLGFTLGIAPVFFADYNRNMILAQGAFVSLLTLLVICYAQFLNEPDKYKNEYRLTLMFPTYTNKGLKAIQRLQDSATSHATNYVVSKVGTSLVSALIGKATGGGTKGTVSMDAGK